MYCAYITSSERGITDHCCKCTGHHFDSLRDARRYISQSKAPITSNICYGLMTPIRRMTYPKVREIEPLRMMAFMHATLTSVPRTVIYIDGSSAHSHSGYSLHFPNGEFPDTYGCVETNTAIKHPPFPDLMIARIYALYMAIQLAYDDIYIVTNNEHCYSVCSALYTQWVGRRKPYIQLWNMIYAISKGRNITISYIPYTYGDVDMTITKELAVLGSM